MTAPTKSTSMPTARARWLVLTAAFLGWMFDGVEMGVFPLAARPALQDLLGVTADQTVGAWMGRITALFLVGAALGGIFFGWLGDRIGRVRSMALSILVYSVFTGGCYFVSQAWQLGALRFIAALGMGGEWALGVALVMESWPEGGRPLLAGAIGAASNIGFMLIAFLGAAIPVTRQSWRWVMLAGAAPAVLTVFTLVCVPESHKWKDSIRGSNAKPFREICGSHLLKPTLLAIAFASIAMIGTWGSVQWLPLWADRLTGGTHPQAKAITQIVSALGAVVGSFVGPLIGGRFGRRPTYCWLCILSLISCGLLFRNVHEYGPLFLGLVCLVGCCTASFYGWLPLYLPELFPTRVRATGQGLSYNAGRVFAAIGALQMGALMQHYGGDYAQAGATITLIYLLGIGLIWLAPETYGRPLPE